MTSPGLLNFLSGLCSALGCLHFQVSSGGGGQELPQVYIFTASKIKDSLFLLLTRTAWITLWNNQKEMPGEMGSLIYQTKINVSPMGQRIGSPPPSKSDGNRLQVPLPNRKRCWTGKSSLSVTFHLSLLASLMLSFNCIGPSLKFGIA